MRPQYSSMMRGEYGANHPKYLLVTRGSRQPQSTQNLSKRHSADPAPSSDHRVHIFIFVPSASSSEGRRLRITAGGLFLLSLVNSKFGKNNRYRAYRSIRTAVLVVHLVVSYGPVASQVLSDRVCRLYTSRL